MKQLFYILTIIIIGVGFSFSGGNKNKSEKTNFALIELFTSQGCSACPPADSVLIELQETYGENLYILSFHVDYWNHLGWEDPYSYPEFSKYQREYDNILGEGVYTPQAIVDGKQVVVGSDKEKVISAVDNKIDDTKSNYGLECVYEEGALFIKYDPGFDFNNVRVNIAYIKKLGITEIKDGELGGRTLPYINIVQRFINEDANKEGLNIVDIPMAPDKDNFELVIYLQNKNDYSIISASRAEF